MGEERKIVIPGEVIIKGEDYLPGEGTQKRDDEIIAVKFGFSEENDNLVKVIPLSGTYQPRKGNVVIGKVEHLTFNGWVIDIGIADNAFLSLNEVPRYVNKGWLEEVMGIGDMVAAKVWGANRKDVNLSVKSRGLGKIEEGIIMKINPSKVSRVIGKEGSMVNLIKEKTECEITVGQNGFIWIRGENVENELFAKKAIRFVDENFYVKGLTDEVTKWLEGENKNE